MRGAGRSDGPGISSSWQRRGAGLAAVKRRSRIILHEELRRPLSVATYSGTLVAVICSVMVARGLIGQLPNFAVRGYSPPPLESFPLVLLIGVVAGLLGVAFNRGLLGLHRFFLGIRAVPAWALPGLVLAAVGLVAWWLPDATGGGHGVAQRLLSDEYPAGVGVLLVLLAAKFAVTVASYASGTPGGIFAPILVLGTITGVIVGHVGGWLLPALLPATAFASLGMAAVPASVRARSRITRSRDDLRSASSSPGARLPRRVPGRRALLAPDLRCCSRRDGARRPRPLRHRGCAAPAPWRPLAYCAGHDETGGVCRQARVYDSPAAAILFRFAVVVPRTPRRRSGCSRSLVWEQDDGRTGWSVRWVI